MFCISIRSIILSPPFDNKEKIYFFNHISCVLRKLLLDRPDHLLICAGDFNAVHNNRLDIISGENHNIDVVSSFNKIIEHQRFIDAYFS